MTVPHSSSSVTHRAAGGRTRRRRCRPAGARLARSALAGGAASILKPLPASWFIDYGTNAETRWNSVDPSRYLTPQARLFVRNHTRTPEIDGAAYRLRIFGDGLDSPTGVQLSLRDLRRRFRTVRVTSVHECTGNGRSLYSSRAGPSAGPRAPNGCSALRRHRDLGEGVLVSATFSRQRASGRTPGRSREPGWTRTSSTRESTRDRSAVRSRSARRWTTRCWRGVLSGEPLLPDHGYPLRLRAPGGWAESAASSGSGSLEVSTTELTSPLEHPVVQRRRSAHRRLRRFRLGGRVGRDDPVPADGRAHGTVLVRRCPDRAGRGEHRRRSQLVSGLGCGRSRGTTKHTVTAGPSGATAGRPRHRGPTSCWPAPPTNAAAPSRTSHPSTRITATLDAVVRHPVTVV